MQNVAIALRVASSSFRGIRKAHVLVERETNRFRSNPKSPKRAFRLSSQYAPNGIESLSKVERVRVVGYYEMIPRVVVSLTDRSVCTLLECGAQRLGDLNL